MAGARTRWANDRGSGAAGGRRGERAGPAAYLPTVGGVALGLTLLLAAGGCRFGELRLTDALGTRPFDPGGTVFAYVDAHDDQLAEVPEPRVVVVMSWLAFDPAQDLRDRPGTELADLRHELSLRDAASLVFAPGATLAPGADFEAVRAVNADAAVAVPTAVVHDDAGFSASLHFAPERLTATTSYDDLIPLASRQTVAVEIERADIGRGGQVAGSLLIELARSDEDPTDAEIGRWSGDFVAPLVEERLAEANLALLGTEPLLGVPLASGGPAASFAPADGEE